jgi:ABC-type sugar transport system substrate-binding protein
MQEDAQGAKDAAKALGASIIVTGPPQPDPTTGVSELQQVVNQGDDGFTIMPLPATLWSKGVQEAAARTRVNIVNTIAVQGIRGSQTYIGINDAVASKQMLDYLFARLGANPTGSIVIGNCIKGGDQDRTLRTLSERPEDKD